MENIARWPKDSIQDEYLKVTKKMHKPVPTSLIFGHHDILANKRSRILSAKAVERCLLLKISNEALFLLTKEALQNISIDC